MESSFQCCVELRILDFVILISYLTVRLHIYVSFFLCIFKPFPIKCFYGKAVKHRCDSVNKTLNQYGECIMCDTLYLKSLEFLFVFFLNTNG